jgi:hypothetical protein
MVKKKSMGGEMSFRPLSREATSFFHIALNLGKVLFTFGS